MLPPFIIEQIRRREEEERRRDRQPVLELPLPMPGRPHEQKPSHDEDTDRGVVIIDLMG
jgi:hypothetical protein